MEEVRLVRAIKKVWKSKPTVEGAGVHLKRAFGFHEAPQLDPFLLLDAFRSENPEDYKRGFPWHPHRGIETITYILDGEVEHGDSLGNRGIISPGDVQWMTAGSGIIHQEMPKGDRTGQMWGFQLWSNLPSKDKMLEPRYREVNQNQIPRITTHEGATVRIICGEIDGIRGPVREIVTDPEFLDVTLLPGRSFSHPTKADHTVFAYVMEGEGYFEELLLQEAASEIHSETARPSPSGEGSMILYGAGARVAVSAEKKAVRFLLITGKPLGEPIAWYGPIVMNTEEELRVAFRELEEGTFVKHAGR